MNTQSNPQRSVKIPGPEHPITVRSNAKRVLVKIGDQVLADTRHALTLQEASYPEVQYIPRADVDMSLLSRSTHMTYCPYKGDCNYFSLASSHPQADNAVWTYEQPFAVVADIKDHLAFYPDRVQITELAV
jgi:uncharacterized protein (DUF427 family)